MARPNNFPPVARHAARKARQARAAARAAKLAPVIEALQAAGVTSLNGIAVTLNERGVVTPTGGSRWHATQVRRVLARLPALCRARRERYVADVARREI
jgi:predicted flap endonuclease-1-like 5' DNA nuclease